MTRLSPEELASIQQHPATNWMSAPSRQRLWGHIDALEAELAAANRRATLAENALVDLLQESYAYAAGRADTAAWVRHWWEDDSRPFAELSDWLDAQPPPP